jgi:hypothetical protein
MIAKIEDKKDQSQNTTAAKRVHDNTLKTAGFSFLLADSALFAYGLATKKSDFGMAAAFGWTEGLVGARYGNPKVEKQLEQIERHLGTYLRQQGVQIPKDPTLHNLTKEGRIIDHIEDFIYKYPAQIMNICYAMIGVSFLRDGIKTHREKPNEMGMITSGALIMAGALGGLLINEKKFDEKHPAKTLWEKIQEKPLRITGTLLNLNLVAHAWDIYKEQKHAPAGNKNYLYRYVAVAAFLLGNTLLALSSKGYGGSAKGADPKLLEHVSDLSARVIAAQPPEVQNSLLEHIAGYLSTQPNVNMKAADISAMLHKKMAEIKTAPAISAGNWVARIHDISGVSPQPLL